MNRMIDNMNSYLHVDSLHQNEQLVQIGTSIGQEKRREQENTWVP